MKKDIYKDLTFLKDFLNQLLGNYTHRIYTAWLNCQQIKNRLSESGDIYLQQFHILKTKIGNESKVILKIKMILLFDRLNKRMQYKKTRK